MIGAAIEVHRSLGPGFLESVYERALLVELEHCGLRYASQLASQILHRGVLVGEHRVDLIVEDQLVVELKAIEHVHPYHLMQVHSYLKAMDLHVGLLINFNVSVLKDGVRRVIRRLDPDQ